MCIIALQGCTKACSPVRCAAADDAAALERVAATAAGEENATSDALAVATQALKLHPLVAKAAALPSILAANKAGCGTASTSDGAHLRLPTPDLQARLSLGVTSAGRAELYSFNTHSSCHILTTAASCACL